MGESMDVCQRESGYPRQQRLLLLGIRECYTQLCSDRRRRCDDGHDRRLSAVFRVCNAATGRLPWIHSIYRFRDGISDTVQSQRDCWRSMSGVAFQPHRRDRRYSLQHSLCSSRSSDRLRFHWLSKRNESKTKQPSPRRWTGLPLGSQNVNLWRRNGRLRFVCRSVAGYSRACKRTARSLELPARSFCLAASSASIESYRTMV